MNEWISLQSMLKVCYLNLLRMTKTKIKIEKFNKNTIENVQGGSKKVSCCTVIDISMAKQ